MPSKKRKYNARFPAGRIKKIMQTDEEVGKVAQAVPVIISRTLELFVESLLKKAFNVTVSRNAKTLSPSHVKQCILAESRFDFLKDLVKNIPDVSAAEEREIISAESSPNSSRFSDNAPPMQRRLTREESVTSISLEPEIKPLAIDLTKKPETTARSAYFYQETLDFSDRQGVIKLNPTYTEPSTSNEPKKYIELGTNNNSNNPILNIDLTRPEAEIQIVRNSKSNMADISNNSSGNLQIDEDYDT